MWRATRIRSGAVAAAGALSAVALLAAGCGGGSGPSVATVGTTSAVATTRAAASTAGPTAAGAAHALAQAVRYAACMRSHGVSHFPDPTTTGGGISIKITPGSGVDPQSPVFQAARKACGSLLPRPGRQRPQLTQAQLAGSLSFAKCMRSHGVPSFPDPTSQGISLEEIRAAHIDIRTPTVVAAAKACVPTSHGAITAAMVKRAEAAAARLRSP